MPLTHYLNNFEISIDDLTNLVYFASKELTLYANAGIYPKMIDLSRIYVSGNEVHFGFHEFLIDLKWNSVSEQNAVTFELIEECKINELILIPPEIFQQNNLNAQTISWFLGSITYFIFEVF